jgi:hypothetical protein
MQNSLSSVIVALGFFCLSSVACTKPIASLEISTLAQASNASNRLGVAWVPNAGQWDGRVAFRASTFAGQAWLTRDGKLVHQFHGKDQVGWVLTETFVGNAPRKIEGVDRQIGTVSFVTNRDLPSNRALETYRELVLGEIFPGIRVSLKAASKNVEKLYTVAPFSDPNAIRMKLEGAHALALTNTGALQAQTEYGPIEFTPPIAFQEESGRRIDIPVRYALDAESKTYGFEVAAYDRSRPLVIDPLLQSTYLGGTNGETPVSIAIHPTSGEIYVSGTTSSTDFPGVGGGVQTTLPGTTSIFVSRFNATLTQLLQSTYFGVSGSVTVGGAMAIHPSNGDVYIAGESSANALPGSSGGAQANNAGLNDAFVTRLNAALQSVIRTSFVGGSASDSATAIAINPSSGQIYIAGKTNSTNLPGASGGAQANLKTGSSINQDGFITRLNADLTTRFQSTYLGGSSFFDTIYAITIHPTTGDVFVTGETSSTDFPGTVGGAQPTNAGGDAFVSRLNSALTSLMQSTYLGGTGIDTAYGIALHPASGDVYIAGTTRSADFPGVIGGAQPTFGGELTDGFLARLSGTLTTRLQTTFLGGNGREEIYAIAIHPSSGEIYVAGNTSTGDEFPGIGGGASSIYRGEVDGFVSRFNPALTTVPQSSYMGGTAFDGIQTLAIRAGNGDVYVAGTTSSVSLPALSGGAQTTKSGPATAGDVFLSRFTAGLDIAKCLDVDGDGAINATTDGLMLVRAMLGMTGTSVTSGAVTGSSPRNNWTSIRQHLNTACGGNFAP